MSDNRFVTGWFHHYSDVLVLNGINGFDVKESASILGWSKNKVRISLPGM
jgi:hypothetical protein